MIKNNLWILFKKKSGKTFLEIHEKMSKQANYKGLIEISI